MWTHVTTDSCPNVTNCYLPAGKSMGALARWGRSSPHPIDTHSLLSFSSQRFHTEIKLQISKNRTTSSQCCWDSRLVPLNTISLSSPFFPIRVKCFITPALLCQPKGLLPELKTKTLLPELGMMVWGELLPHLAIQWLDQTVCEFLWRSPEEAPVFCLSRSSCLRDLSSYS